MRAFLYILTIAIVPGGFLFCIAHFVGRIRKRQMIEARINRITRAALDQRQSDPESWERAPAYGHGSASNYVPEWAVPVSKHPKRRKTDAK
jgi:hypothetical protein